MNVTNWLKGVAPIESITPSTRMKLNFYELHDGHGKPYYLNEIKISDVEKIWEERSQSSLDLPLPEGLALRKEIDLPNEFM